MMRTVLLFLVEHGGNVKCGEMGVLSPPLCSAARAWKTTFVSAAPSAISVFHGQNLLPTSM